MIILFLIGYFKVCDALDDKKLYKVYYVFLMTILFGLSIMTNFILLNQQNDYEKEIKNLKKGLPKYKEIHGVYIIEKK